jgi:hypothetical protein
MGDNLGPNRVVEGLQSFLLQIDEAEIVAHRADEPNTIVDFLDSETLSGEHGKDVHALCVHADTSAGGDERIAIMQWIGPARRPGL